MIKKIQQMAIALRRRGYSYREISEQLSVPRSTIRLWVQAELVSELGRQRLSNLIVLSQIKAKQVLLEKQKKYKNDLEIRCSVLKNKSKYTRDNLKLFLALMYWAEGSKTEKRLSFTNSDPEMISTYVKLLRASFNIKEEKISAVLHLHDYHNREEMINFWSKTIGIDKKRISIYNKEHSGLRKKEEYKGCISVRYSDYQIFDEMMLIIKRFSVLKI